MYVLTFGSGRLSVSHPAVLLELINLKQSHNLDIWLSTLINGPVLATYFNTVLSLGITLCIFALIPKPSFLTFKRINSLVGEGGSL